MEDIQNKQVSKWVIVIMALAIAVIVLGIIIAMIIVLPNVGSKDLTLPFSQFTLPVGPDGKIIIAVALTGALGSIIHLISSFVKFVGENTFEENWIMWYLLRPFIGMSLALIFYYAVRGGLFSAGSDSGDLNIYGIITIAGLAGMFSKNATEKLSELFETLFQTRQKENGN